MTCRVPGDCPPGAAWPLRTAATDLRHPPADMSARGADRGSTSASSQTVRVTHRPNAHGGVGNKNTLQPQANKLQGLEKKVSVGKYQPKLAAESAADTARMTGGVRALPSTAPCTQPSPCSHLWHLAPPEAGPRPG